MAAPPPWMFGRAYRAVRCPHRAIGKLSNAVK